MGACLGKDKKEGGAEAVGSSSSDGGGDAPAAAPADAASNSSGDAANREAPAGDGESDDDGADPRAEIVGDGDCEDSDEEEPDPPYTDEEKIAKAVFAGTPQSKCPGCQLDFDDEEGERGILSAARKTWHPHCFKCKSCARELLASDDFVVRAGSPYHEPCYDELFGKKCMACDAVLRADDEFLTALGYTFHPEHFVCGVCSRPFDTGAAIPEGEGAAPAAKAGGEKETDPVIIKMHQQRDAKLAPQPIREVDGKLLCNYDYYEATGHECVVCKHKIHGNHIDAVNRHFHPEHFLCRMCKKRIPENVQFHEYKGGCFDKKCYPKLFINSKEVAGLDGMKAGTGNAQKIRVPVNVKQNAVDKNAKQSSKSHKAPADDTVHTDRFETQGGAINIPVLREDSKE